MPLTVINPTIRYVHPQTVKIYWVPSIVDVNAYTRAEINTGWDLTAEIADMQGWEVTPNRVQVPDGGTLFTGVVNGRTNPGDAQAMFYASKDGNDIRLLLEEGDRGNMLILHGGDVAGRLSDCYPSEVASVSTPVNISGDNAAQITVGFSIHSLPGRNIPVPA